MPKWAKRAVSACLAVLLFGGAIRAAAKTTSDYDDEISAVKQQQAENEAEAERLEEKLEELRQKTADAEEYQKTLQEKIANYQERIDLARARIDELNDNITYLEGEIRKADEKHAATLEQLKERLRAMYISGGELTSMQILMDSTSLYDYALRSEAVKSVSKHDTELMNKIKEYLLETQDQREELAAQKAELADQKKDLEAAQDELKVLEAENAALIEELNLQSSETEEQIAENEAESAEFLAELDALIEARNEQAKKEEEERRRQEEEERRRQEEAAKGGGGTTPSGPSHGSEVLNTGDLNFGWPLVGYGRSYITMHYGEYFGGSAHMGMDIGVPYGTPIYASESGEVLSAEYHWSWGNNVLIWHNSTYSTRYAHMSSMAVSAGQYVEKGQIIGYVGATGYAFGNHLHFEVYQNGSRVNPENFV